MKTIALVTAVILFVVGCDAPETGTKSPATTEYSRTLDQAREAADQLEKSLSTSAQRMEDAKQ